MNRKELIEHFNKKTYLGDSVYIYFDGYHFILETHNGFHDDPRNRIALEYEVAEAFIRYRKNLYEAFEDLRERESNKKEE